MPLLVKVSVKGTVTDPGRVSLLLEHTLHKGANGVGTVTDYDGNFNLKVPANGTLVFSYAGYKRQEVSVAGNLLSVSNWRRSNWT